MQTLKTLNDKKVYKDNIVLIFGIYTNKIINKLTLESINQPQVAADNFQKGIIEGIYENKHIFKSIKIINYPFISSFPFGYKSLLFNPNQNDEYNGLELENLSFLNLPILKDILIPKRLKKYLSINLKNKESDIAFLYSLQIRNIIIARWIKKKYPLVQLYITINDIPSLTGMNGKPSMVKRVYKHICSYIIKKNLSIFDNYVVVSDEIRKYYGLNALRCKLLECIVPSINISPRVSEYSEKSIRSVVYAGGLNKQYGVDLLIDAISKITLKDVEFHFYGNGPLFEKISQKSDTDSRIKLHGSIPYDNLKVILKDADLLVNPRPINQEFTKYSFPIKLFDYLFAGGPVICGRLHSINKEYDQYLTYFDGLTSGSLAATITECLKQSRQSVLKQKQETINFMCNNKSSARLIYELFKN